MVRHIIILHSVIEEGKMEEKLKHLAITILSMLTIFILLTGCKSSNYHIEPDDVAKGVFTQQELTEIEKMILFTDSAVSAKTGKRDLNESYHAFIEKLSIDAFNGKPLTPITCDSAKLDFLETINDDALSTIWRIGLANTNLSSKQIKILDLNPGKYFEYLRETAKTEKLYDKIYEEINRSFGLTPSVVAVFLKNHHEFDFSVYKHRLWATVFLLYIGEPIEIP